MKKIFISLFILAFLFCGCADSNMQPEFKDMINPPLVLKQGTLGDTGHPISLDEEEYSDPPVNIKVDAARLDFLQDSDYPLLGPVQGDFGDRMVYREIVDNGQSGTVSFIYYVYNKTDRISEKIGEVQDSVNAYCLNEQLGEQLYSLIHVPEGEGYISNLVCVDLEKQEIQTVLSEKMLNFDDVLKADDQNILIHWSNKTGIDEWYTTTDLGGQLMLYNAVTGEANSFFTTTGKVLDDQESSLYAGEVIRGVAVVSGQILALVDTYDEKQQICTKKELMVFDLSGKLRNTIPLDLDKFELCYLCDSFSMNDFILLYQESMATDHWIKTPTFFRIDGETLTEMFSFPPGYIELMVPLGELSDDCPCVFFCDYSEDKILWMDRKSGKTGSFQFDLEYINPSYRQEYSDKYYAVTGNGDFMLGWTDEDKAKNYYIDYEQIRKGAGLK